MVCNVFPNPISSAKIPFTFLSYRLISQFNPWKKRNECKGDVNVEE